jgi:tetratricopeptide (TPR) repeat protein
MSKFNQSENSDRSRSVPQKNRTYVPKYPSRTLAEDNMGGYLSTRSPGFPHELTKPQRIELPVYFNTPRRFVQPRPASPQKPAANTSFPTAVDLEKKTMITKRLKDYSMLAFACKRAGKTRDEGRAYYSTGVLYDNLNNYTKAIAAYEKFLTVCQSIGDSHGEALAYNCIGVDYHHMAENEPEKDQLWQEAINYHTKHKEIADVPGKFLAHINLGLIYNKLGDSERAAINHQFALRYAIQMSSVAGQSVAIGNLGQIGYSSMNGDNEKLKMFAERYLALSHELKNRKGESGAYQQLGNISLSVGDYDTSTKNFYRAMKIAEEIQDKDMMESARCNFGVANASMKMEEHMKAILGQIGQNK